MESNKLARINQLAKKAKSAEGLTDEERAEQAALRREYVDSFKQNLVAQLENTYMVDEQGNKKKLQKRDATEKETQNKLE